MKARVERSRTMNIIGCDYHPGFQQIAFVDTETGDCGEQRLEHSEGAEKFYRDLAAQGKKVRVGMEASGHAHWFERLLAELNFELWIGDATEIARKRERNSADLGTELGESRSAATAVASAPHGAGAHPHHESAASRSPERRLTLQEEVMAGARTGTTGIVPLGTLGKPATTGSAGGAGSAEPDDRGTES